MKEVRSVFREPGGERVLDPATLHVEVFNKLLEMIKNEDLAKVIDHHAEEIVKVRLRQDNVIYEGSETETMYHDQGRWNSGITREKL